jgi:hypothetical protein
VHGAYYGANIVHNVRSDHRVPTCDVVGLSLVQFGRTSCKLASLQRDYTGALQNTFIQTLQTGLVTFQEYCARRAKLDSRR